MDNYYCGETQKKSLILAFSGWSFNYYPFLKLEHKNYDLIIFYNYKNIELDDIIINRIKSYEKLNIVAWSMGVLAAGIIAEKYNLKIEKAIAVNGTLSPIDNEYGIPEHIFDATLANLSKQNMIKFYKRSGVRPEIINDFLCLNGEKNIEDYKNELSFFRELGHSAIAPENIFDTAVISTRDAIFPPQNLMRFWTNKAKIITLELPHFIFNEFNSYDELFKM